MLATFEIPNATKLCVKRNMLNRMRAFKYQKTRIGFNGLDAFFKQSWTQLDKRCAIAKLPLPSRWYRYHSRAPKYFGMLA